MPIVVPKSGGYLHTANGCWTVAAANLSTFSSNRSAMYIAPTSSACNCQEFTPSVAGAMVGAALPVCGSDKINNRNFRVSLQENIGTCTLTIASPCVVTKVGHGLSAGDRISFKTTGVLPTNATGTTPATPKLGAYFYVLASGLTADTFQFSPLPGGAVVNTGGTQSGTHTLWVDRQNFSLTPDEMYASADKRCNSWVDFPFTYPITNVASTWRFIWNQEGGTVGNWQMHYPVGDATFPYAVWVDVATTYALNDTLVVAYPCKVKETTTINGVLGAGDTANGVACIICRNQDPTVDNVAKLVFEEGSAPYTFTFNGAVIFGSHAGLRVGTSAAKISSTNKITITTGVANVGTLIPLMTSLHNSATFDFGRGSIFLYGESPTYLTAPIASDVAINQKVIETTVPTGWTAGMGIVVGKQNIKGQGDLNVYTIASVVGNTITTTNNIVTNVRKAGGEVAVINANGISWTRSTTATLSYIVNPSSFVFDGVDFNEMTFQPSSSHQTFEEEANSLGIIVNKITTNGATQAYFMYIAAHRIKNEFTNSVFHRQVPIRVVTSIHSTGWDSGRIKVENNALFCIGSLGMFTQGTLNHEVDYINNRVYNSIAGGYVVLYLNGNSWNYHDNYFWGMGSTIGGVSALQLINPLSVYNNRYENCTAPIAMWGISKGVISKNDIFGQETPNTYDVVINPGALADWEFQSPTGEMTVDITNQAQLTPGSEIRITDENDTANKDRMILTNGNYARTGDGLSDTTVYESGTGKFALRMESKVSTLPLECVYELSTPNLLGKAITVGLMCKINSAAYWAGTHVMPRIVVTYDGTSTVYGEAAQTTEWQYIHASFIPTTATGYITVTLQTQTDATSSDAYVYFDEWSGGFLVNTSMDSWKGAKPVSPAYSFNVNAATFWDAAESTQTKAGTMGKKVKGDLSLIKYSVL